MSISPRHKRKAESWAFAMATGVATHEPTGLQIRFVPGYAPEVAGLKDVGRVELPAGVRDVRPPGKIDPGDANAPGVDRWTLWADPRALEAAREHFVQGFGAELASKLLDDLLHDVGDRWLFRVRLERGWRSCDRAT